MKGRLYGRRSALHAALNRANARHFRRLNVVVRLRDTYWQELLGAALQESDSKHAARTPDRRRPLGAANSGAAEVRELKLQLERERRARWDLLAGAMKQPIAFAAPVDLASALVAACVEGDAPGSVQETPRKPGVFRLWRPVSRSDSSRFGSFLDR